MDSRDEAKIRQREEQLARRVGEALDRMTPNPVHECPDAEVIAAYAEKALSPEESSQWEGHFAACARCRTVLRVLTASADTPLAQKEVARLGQLVSPVRTPVDFKEKSSERARPRLLEWPRRWVAPALGVAAVLAVWFAMRPPWRAPEQDASGTLIAQAPKDELPSSPAPAAENRVSNDALQRDQKTAAAPSQLSAESQPFNAPPSGGLAKGRADAANSLDRVSPNSGSRMSSVQEEKKLRVPAEERQTQVPPAPPSPAESAKEKAAMAAPAPEPQSQAKVASNAAPSAAAPQMEKDDAKRGADASLRDKQQVTAQAQAPEASRSRVAGAVSSEMQKSPRNEQTFDVLRSAQPYSALLKAPSGSTLWRAGKGGTIERSTDAGKIWTSQGSPSQEDWLAGAAASDTVCWLVGRNGTIARTTDGTRWQRVAPPSQAAAAARAKSQDWVGVTASDAQSATITAGDGRRFATHDGGKTWQSQ
jgi:hypothetical protein